MPPKQTLNIDFESDLWNAANELRGAVAENQYKDFVLSILFLKHLSERYDIRREWLQNAFNDKNSGYCTDDQAEQEEILNDLDEYASQNIVILPDEASWDYLRNNAEQDNIKVIVDEAFIKADELLAELNPAFKGLLPPIFVKSQLTTEQTAGLIHLFSKDKFSEKTNPEKDIFGEIYQYYIGKFAQAEGAGAGQFFTPESIVQLLVEMLEPLKGRIFDPACGSGGMFVQSLKFIQSHEGKKGDIAIYGQERYEGTLRLCKINLMLRNLSFDIKLGDSLLDDKHQDLKADYIIANPPFNVSQWHSEKIKETDPRLLGPREEFTTDGNANFMWMQTFWSHLSETGTAGTVMANGAMTSNASGEKQVRQKMVEEGIIDCVVRLPEKLFLTTGIPACLFFLSKNRDGNDGIHRARKGEVLFIDASKLGEMKSRKQRVLTPKDMDQIAGIYHNWRNIDGNFEEEAGFIASVSLDKIAENDFKLTPGIYVGTAEEEDDGIPFETKMAGLKAQLADQFTESTRLQALITDNLKEF